ncbi:9051_t:CDS:2 [Gigaspora margarita]|uniref:9051_t:CDS:1 n=1 Tax=Gigaspora margarita TaxID=4874 RepID=A0ABN7W9K7_GIGMA|nr:9051_t:CDS:2 [Gigaspora margarita]
MNYNRRRPDFNMKYITRCLNKHYFLVDTKYEDAQYMELYNLKTNQLVNTFHRQNLYESSFIVDIPDFFAISDNKKILAYRSGNQIKLYLMECGLELASIKLNTDEPSPIDYFMLYFMHFFNNDEKLLICRSEKKSSCEWSIWESIQKSIRFENKLDFNFFQMNNIFIESIDPSFYQLERTNSLVIIFKNKERQGNLSEDKRIYGLEKLEKEDKVEKKFKGRDIWVRKRNLLRFEDHKSLLDENYHICDPWVQPNDGPHPNDGGSPQYFVYLDKEKKIILLIGNYTVQVCVINRDDRERCINRIYKKFKLSPHFKDSQSIEIGGDNYVIDAVNEALSKLDQLSHIKPVQNSLLHKRSLHMPQYNSWEGGENVIRKALSNNHPIFLGYFLEYYSNKAAEKIGWMITVSEILPKLYDKDNKNHGFYSFMLNYYFISDAFVQRD